MTFAVRGKQGVDLEIFSKYLAIFGLRVRGERSHHDWDDGEVTSCRLHHLGNVGQLHLYTVLVLVRVNAHQLKLAWKKGGY